VGQFGGTPAEIRDTILALGIPLIGESKAFLDLLRSIRRIAMHSDTAVLIHGETGTGKELVARSIHYLGARQRFPFVPVNCGALPDSLVENELFGHRVGAFTGATQESGGLLRLAHNGTLFLDEVDSLPAKAQVALLRFLQDGRFRPLGGAGEQHANVRILAASNRCLEHEIAAGRFREDLYYRLNVIRVVVPPLRTRAGDVRLLSQYFLRACAERYRLPGKRLQDDTLCWLERYRWPGNVRELENLIHREFLLSDEHELRIEAPSRALTTDVQISLPESGPELTYHAAKSLALEQFDRTYLTKLLRRAHGNVTRAAELAGKERRALGKLLKRYRIGRTAGDDLGPPR